MRTLIATLSVCLVCTPVIAHRPPPRTHRQVVNDVAGMVSNSHARSMVQKKGLRILNVMWEDTGRYKGSSVGPNISDVTIEVQSEDRRGKLRTSLMPVIRFPNFHDKTGDIKLDKFYIRVGNQRKNGRLRTIKLREFLRHPTRYMSLPKKGRIKGGSLLANRDSHVLVSAQAAFLPIRTSGQTKFWPVIFNYQSTKGHPAVLTLLVTRQGTSMTIIDNARDTVGGGRSWGQRLYFNTGGKRAPLTAERLSTVKQRGSTSNGESAASLGQDANLLMLIQVPLKIKRPRRGWGYGGLAGGAPVDSDAKAYESAPKMARRRGGSDVEQAVLGHGPTEGPYTELDGLTIQRDPRFPVRVTVQFYQATSNGVLSKQNVDAFAKKIGKVYKQADFVGSLVVPGHSGRPTEYTGVTPPPPGLSFWDFPGLVERCYHHGKPCRTPRWGILPSDK
jgi:hypothetical protein